MFYRTKKKFPKIIEKRKIEIFFFNNIKNLKNPQYFKSWLGQIISNLFYDELRKKQKQANAISIDSFWQDENKTLAIKIKKAKKTLDDGVASC